MLIPIFTMNPREDVVHRRVIPQNVAHNSGSCELDDPIMEYQLDETSLFMESENGKTERTWGRTNTGRPRVSLARSIESLHNSQFAYSSLLNKGY